MTLAPPSEYLTIALDFFLIQDVGIASSVMKSHGERKQHLDEKKVDWNESKE